MGKLFRNIVLVALACLLASCVRRYPELDRIESIVGQSPEYALIELDSLGDAGHAGQSYLARYAALYAMALDKSSIDDGSYLPEIRKFERYYERHGSAHERMLFHYYYGDQLADSLKCEEAAVQFLKALSIADEEKDWFYCGMSCRGLADLLSSAYNNDACVSYYSKAGEYFRKAGKGLHDGYAKLQLSTELMNCGRFSAAEEKIHELVSDAKELGDSTFMLKVLKQNAYFEQKSGGFAPDSVIRSYEDVIEHGVELDSYDYAGLALAYKRLGDIRKGQDCLDSSYAKCNSDNAYMYAMSAEKRFLEDSGNLKRRLELAETLLEMEDTLTLKALEASIVSVQQKYYKEQARVEELKKERVVMMYIFSCILFLLFILGMAFLVVRYSQRKRLSYEMKLHEYVRTVDEVREKMLFLQRSDEVRTSDLLFLTKILDEILKKQYALNRNDPLRIQPYYEILGRLRNDESCRIRLESAADSVTSNGVSKLRAAYPEIKTSDVLLFSLLVLGFSYKSISIILEEGESKLYNRAKRLREKVQATGTPDAGTVVSSLYRR